MRDVRSLASHLLFRDRTCEEIPELLASDEPLTVVDMAYFKGPGGLGVPDGSVLERGAELLSIVDVALVANPEDDRAIAGGRVRGSCSSRTELPRTCRIRAMSMSSNLRAASSSAESVYWQIKSSSRRVGSFCNPRSRRPAMMSSTVIAQRSIRPPL